MSERNTRMMEIRTIDTEPLELRATADGTGSTFAGYAIRYDSPSLPLPFTERVRYGAVTRSLKAKNDVRMYVNHDDRMVLASTRSKTLRLDDRPEGLYVEADLPDVSYANDLRELISKDIVRTMSFGFSTVKDSWSDDGSQRTLEEIRLHEVSVVTGVAAYPETTASVRSMLIPAYRAKVDVDELGAAIDTMLAGEQLSPDQAAMLRQVIASLTQEDDPEDVAEQMLVEQLLNDAPRSMPVSLMRDRLAMFERALRA